MRARLSQVPINSLIQVLAVAERLNFHHAAASLGVSQSSVSARIKALEENLGILIFERRHRGVRLTEAGRLFVAEVAIGMGHLDHAVITAGAMASGIIGRIRVGVCYPVFGGFVAELHRRFRASHSGVELLVVEDLPDRAMRRVREGDIDIAFVLGRIEGIDCHVRRLWTEPFVIALPDTHALAGTDPTWRDLACETFLVPSGGSGSQLQDHIVRRLTERGMRPRIRRYEAGRNTMMHLVATGEGVKLTTHATRYIPFPGIAFREIADEMEPAEFSALWSPHNRSASLQALLTMAGDMGCLGRLA